MKTNFSHIGLAKLCGWFGLTRQAYYQNGWKGIDISIEEEILLSEVSTIREVHKRMGTRKLHDKLYTFMIDHQIKMGRDALFDLLSSNHMLVRKRTRRIQTTQSHHWLRKYKNLIRGFVTTGSNQLWVSDITYWKINGIYVYISFITDAFSRKVVGYHVALTLETVETIKALKMALSELILEPNTLLNLIHHSDRGLQYCSNQYVEQLQKHNIHISMTEENHCYENAIAERVNGILKDEFYLDQNFANVELARKASENAIKLYNNKRLHLSLGYKTPNMVFKNVA